MSSMLTLAGNAAPTGFYDFPIEQSLRFEDGDSAYLSRTPASAGNRKTWTWSGWVKRGGAFTSNQSLFSTSTNYDDLRFSTSGELLFVGGTSGCTIATTSVYRDPSAWMSIILSYNSTEAISSDRVKLYVNGEQVTSLTTAIYPALNRELDFNNTVAHAIGRRESTDNLYADLYLADVNFIDGQALDPTSFGELKSGIWIPKDTSGLTFGTNGFRLQFGDTTEASGFNAVTWTGNDVAGHSINGCGFSPDLVWIKNRDVAEVHNLNDTVRGAGLQLFSNTTDAEFNRGAVGLTSFDSDGFSLGVGGEVNDINEKYVAWAWDAGSGSAASNTDGSITSTVKANTDYGFSITSYTGNGSAGATVGHSLGVQPDMIIVKNRSAVQNWRVYHSSQGSSKGASLNTTDAFASAGYWNNTDPTSTVFSVDGSAKVNASGNNYIAYCFAEKTGYSKIGSFVGTGAAGNSITGLGFAPAFVMIKRSDSTGNWFMLDNTRSVTDPRNLYIISNSANAEKDLQASDGVDFVDFDSDGFTIQNNGSWDNASGGTYIYMAFADTRDAAFWRDTSGQGNDWQPNNLVFSDVVPDSTTNNFAVLNNLETNDSGATYTEGNLVLQTQSAGSNVGVASFSIPKSSKWYWEVNVLSTSGTIGDNARIGLQVGNNITPSLDVRYKSNGDKSVNNASSAYGASYAAGDIIGVAVDADSNTVEFYKNGSSQGSISYTMDADSDYFPVLPEASGTINIKFAINFGQDSTFAGNEASGGNTDANGLGDFFSTVPDGALSLCSSNLPTGAIDTLADETPEDYFNTVLYTGNGSTQSITGVNFQPSLTWIKSRSNANSHELTDAVRGVALRLLSDEAEAEASGKVSSFDSDGFSLTADGNANRSGYTYASWNWKANGAGVSNTDGSITSTVSVGSTSQQNWFSVVSFTGDTTQPKTVGHGLNVTPDLILLKNRDTTDNWSVYHSSVMTGGDGKFMRLNTTDALLTDGSDNVFDTGFSSTTFGVGRSSASGGASDFIAYCFANAEGLCKVGSYTGNGSTDGTFIHTGFRPALVLVKSSSNTSPWLIMDNTRDTDNQIQYLLRANSNGAETTNAECDFLSNGFKYRGTSTNSDYYHNVNTATYIYLAIAEQPFKYANAR